MAADTYPILDIFWTMLEVFVFVLWIWLLIAIFTDIFRSHDLSGGGKAAWFIIVLIVPLLGVLIYLIVRGGSMHERAVAQAKQEQQDFDDYVRQVGGSGNTADQLSKLADLRAKGVLSEAEFDAEKAKLLT